ncbi:MAG TPA: methyltransferase domain-containing protein [Candidatus Limnocylindrales bacterium]|nr:methyltransferase domain-containing protein [Candidatus Limnocylindrales bacterium]
MTNDGRADVVPVSPTAWNDLDLRVAETVCADLGAIRLLPSVRATAAQISESQLDASIARLRRLDLVSQGAPLRLVVRLQNEKGFSRSALRDAVARRLGSRVTRGHEEANEVWLIQDTRRSVRVGLRVKALEPVRPTRAAERPGSLRPAIAAGMIGLGGQRPGRLLDPCCGSGTILGEAQLAGWHTVGGDYAIDALESTSKNFASDVVRLDARRLPFRDNEFELVVSNLPFGHQYEMQGAPVAWYRRTLNEALRVAPRAILLAPPSPPFRQALGRLKVALAERHPVEVLGRPATIWVIERVTR